VIAVVPVRDGQLPHGAVDAVAAADGHALLVGTGVAAALDALDGHAATVVLAEAAGPFARLVAGLAAAEAVAGHDVVVLPTAPDGRDLAPALAHALGRPLLPGALTVTADGAACTRWGGRVVEDVHVNGPFVATLQPSGGAAARGERGTPTITEISLSVDAAAPSPEVRAVLPPDVTSMDLSEAGRIVGGGAGLDAAERFTLLQDVAAAMGAAMGGTRVITDRGWIAHERQIGTTGVVVRPQLYLAFGVSGAVQHTSGLGDPDHVISVNTDPHCPMMQLADIALVADANATLAELADRLGVTP
jgi:electron transfer flavoprotein alpha subunit